MEFHKNSSYEGYALKFTAEEGGSVVGRAFLYVLKNDLHEEPFGLLEDVFVEEEYRSKGVGSELVKKVIQEAKEQGCYKLICTSRTSNEKAHVFYERFGFKNHGFEFRIDF